MPSLSNRARSESHSLASGENGGSQDNFGWNDPDQETSDTNTLEAKIIKLANSKVTVSQVFKSYDISFENKAGLNGWINFSCPFKDHQDTNPSFGYNVNSDIFKCLGCGRQGRAVEFISFYFNITPLEAAQAILDKSLQLQAKALAEIEEFDNRIQKHLLNFSDQICLFLERYGFNPEALNYVASITWPLDAYVRNHLRSQSINLDQLRARIQICQNFLDNYGE